MARNSLNKQGTKTAACTAELFHILFAESITFLLNPGEECCFLKYFLVTQFPLENIMPLVRSPETVDARHYCLILHIWRCGSVLRGVTEVISNILLNSQQHSQRNSWLQTTSYAGWQKTWEKPLSTVQAATSAAHVATRWLTAVYF